MSFKNAKSDQLSFSSSRKPAAVISGNKIPFPITF